MITRPTAPLRPSPMVAIALLALLGACGKDSPTPSTPTVASSGTTATPPPPTPVPTATPTATPTPAPSCSVSMSAATFDPAKVICPAGTTTQTVRVVFDLTAGNHVPITINRVSSANVTCRYSRGSCIWSEGSLSFSPSVVAAGTRAQIVATQQFTCGSSGGGLSLGELIFGALYVNTSCGAAQELKLTNVLSLG